MAMRAPALRRLTKFHINENLIASQLFLLFSSLTLNGAKYGSRQKRLANDDSYAELDGNKTHDDNNSEDRKS